MTTIRPVTRCVTALLACLLTLVGLPAGAQAPGEAVSDVAVLGNVNISREAILGVVSIKPGTPFSLEAVTRDVAAIRDLGYFQRVSHREEDTGRGVRVIFEVVENGRITGINITGNTKITTQALLDKMTTKVGDVLNIPRFTRDLDSLQQMYLDNGYLAFVNVSQDNYIAPEGVLNIPIVEVKIERFDVEKTKKTRKSVILREILTPPGSVYDRKALTADLIRIYNTGILEDIQYRTEPGSAQDRVIIVLQPLERKTGQVELGFGYSSQQGLIGRAGLSESNFKGTGTAIGVAAEVGGRYRAAGIPPLSIEANYFQPYIDRRRTSFSASLYNKTTYRFSNAIVGSGGGGSGQAYEVRRGGSLGIGRPISRNTRVQLSLRNDGIRTYSTQDDYGVDAVQDDERSSNVASLGLSLVSDTRDDRQFDPAAGFLFTVGSEVGHTRLGKPGQRIPGTSESSSGVFLKPAMDFRRYIAITPRTAINVPTRVLAFRVKAGTANGPLTFFDQYFVGGADSLRGYREDRFWGKNQILANAEIRWPFANNIQGVAFFDAGDAWGSGLRGNAKRYADYLNWRQNDFDSNGDGIRDPQPPYTIYDAYEYDMPQHNGLTLHTGVGLGLRVKTPIGPLRLDYGISKEGNRTHFSISQAF